MKKIFLIVSFFSLLTAHAASPEWIDLFNGKNLDGWHQLNGTAQYRVEGNEIIGISKMGTPNSFLATDKTYGDFILEYEMCMETGLNSGVQIRSLSDLSYQSGRVHGYQVECDDSERRWSAGIYDEARRNWLYPMEYNQAAKSAYKRGEWNKFRVECIGSSIRTWLNGVPCANLVDELTASGFIALQVHQINDAKLAGKNIRWRGIRILINNPERYATRRIKEVPEVSYLNNRLTSGEIRQGWKLLWDGKSMKGWVNATDGQPVTNGWTISNGILTVNKQGNKANSDIVTERKYQNFTMELDFSYTPGANSGIKYFIQKENDKPSYSTIGCEYQILDDKRHPDAKMGRDGNRTLASLYDLIAANPQLLNPAINNKQDNGAGNWNRARIVVSGKQVIHYLNGVKVLEITRGDEGWRSLVALSKFAPVSGFGEYSEGHLLLQNHGDEVSFRNIKIKVK